jgi:dipeptidyl aminopeptidase/acylaminoacyl peptidase
LNIRAAHSPVFSPDGSRAAFLTDITGNLQVWSVDAGGEGECWPRQLTFLPDKVWDVYGTPAAEHMIAVSDVAGNERHQFYLITNYGVDAQGVAAHEVRRLTREDAAIHNFGVWSRDGQSFLYSSNARNQIDFDLYRMDLPTGQTELLCECQGRRSVVGWSSDGRFVLSTQSVASGQSELFVLDLAAADERHLTAGQPVARYGAVCWVGDTVYLLSDRPHDRGALCRLNLEDGGLEVIVDAAGLYPQTAPHGGELEQLAVSPDGRLAALEVNTEGLSRLFLVELATGAVEPVAELPDGVVSGLGFSADGAQLVFAMQTPRQPQDVWLLTLKSRKLRRLTYSDGAGIDASAFVAPELIHFPSFDGRRIPAYYYRPQSAPPAGGYPCLLYVHGGPASQQRPDFDVRFQAFLRQGYAILATNVRGSTGYGRAYMLLDDVERRMDSVADLKYAVAWLQRRAEIDAARIAIYGRSYGGFMVLAALTEYPELFAAGINVVGIADWVTFLERTSPWRRAHREQEYGNLTEHRDFLRSISPLHKAERIRCPLLVMAGDNDPRVPLYESEQIVEKVRSVNGVVEFVHYADEGHQFSKLANRIDSFTKMAAFLQTHLGNGAG